MAEPLTRAEEAVLRRLTTTLSLREISRERNVSRDTIKGQVRSIYRKLGASDRHEAVRRARELGLLTRRKSLDPGSGKGLLSVPAR
jgi:DNA-binding NarL/FixJ family response regulator